MTSPAALQVGVGAARRMAVVAQGLDGPVPRRRPGRRELLAVCERLGCLQLDPTGVVARSHLLVLFSRLGAFDPADLDALAYGERRLFEYWAHEASLVLSAEFPLYAWEMRRQAEGTGRGGAWLRRLEGWRAENERFQEHVLERLEADGPLAAGAIENRSLTPAISDGWGQVSERSVARMLDLLWVRGEVGVSRREGGKRLWDLLARCLPAELPRETLSDRQVVRRAALRALRMLGVARAPHIRAHFTRNRYPDLEAVLAELAADGVILPVAVGDLGGGWWVHAADAELLASLDSGERRRGRTTLLSPFDNLLCDRARTEQLFGFSHRLEIYVPRAKRRWGYFVMPILHGDRLVGRADLAIDRRAGRLVVHALHREPDAPRGRAMGAAVARALQRLAAWREAGDVELAGTVPEAWRAGLSA